MGYTGKKNIVSIARYEQPMLSVKRAADLSRALDGLKENSKVFIKPNIVFWSRSEPFPKWGVVTTSRVVEDITVLLKDLGIEDITIGEGMVIFDPKDRKTPELAFKSLGYDILKKRYGIRYVNVHERPFEKVDLGDGIRLNFSSDMLGSDFVVNLPVLKTHSQTIVSLGIKNLKGLLDVKSRKKCHSPDGKKDLHLMVSKLHGVLPPCFTLLDGIYTIERGPGFDGNARRSNLLVASKDILSCDMVGARLLGYDSNMVPHIDHALKHSGRPDDLSDIEIVGEKIEELTSRHEYLFPYTENGSLPVSLQKIGVDGLSYRKYDDTICTYCSFLNGPILSGIARAWDGKPWDEIEVLTGKKMKPTPGKKKTILIGKCIYQANKNDPNINQMFPVKGCPPSLKSIIRAFHMAGVNIDPSLIENLDGVPGTFMKKYEGKENFDESFFRVT